MSNENLTQIPQSCPMGLTESDLAALFPDPIERTKFNKWMFGQTATMCEGRQFNHDTREYEMTDCAEHPHGYITYRHDVEQYLRGGNPFD